MARISEPFVVPLDVKCLNPGCTCFREAVLGGVSTSGDYLAPAGERDCPACGHPSTKHTVIGETKSDYEKKNQPKFNRMYGFDVYVNEAANSIDYTCKRCGAPEHGGGIPNPGLYERMKQHLRESDGLHKNDDRLKREDVVDERGHLVEVWFGYDS